jgi:NADH dehydrogenase/putative oxidoreductase
MAVVELQAIDAFYWSLFLALLLLQGSGPLALDHLLARQLHRRFPQLEGWSDIALEGLPHVVIVGAGLRGLKIATLIRGMFRDQHNLRVLLNEVTGVDSQAQQVLMGDTRIHYDYLVLATGARHSYFAWDSKPVRGLAPAAKQQGFYVTKVIRARLERRKAPPPSDTTTWAIWPPSDVNQQW